MNREKEATQKRQGKGNQAAEKNAGVDVPLQENKGNTSAKTAAQEAKAEAAALRKSLATNAGMFSSDPFLQAKPLMLAPVVHLRLCVLHDCNCPLREAFWAVSMAKWPSSATVCFRLMPLISCRKFFVHGQLASTLTCGPTQI